MARRKDGLLEKTVTIEGKRIHVYGKTQKEIKEKIDELYYQSFKGTLGINERTTFEAYTKHWLEVYLVGYAHNTELSYTRAANHLIKGLGKHPIGDLKRSEIEKALNNHADAPTMRNKMLSVCRMIFAMAIDDGLVLSNPAANIKKEKEEHKGKDRFTEKEIEAIKNADFTDMERLMVDLLYNTGIRRGELLGITPKSISNGILHVTQQSQFDKNGKGYVSDPKTFKSKRDIPVPKWLENEFKEYVKNHPSVYVFEPIRNKNQFYRVWRQIMYKVIWYYKPDYIPPSEHDPKMSDIPCDITPHYFRHNYASILYDNKVDVKTAQKLLGHASIATTLGIYTHLSEGVYLHSEDVIRDIFKAV